MINGFDSLVAGGDIGAPLMHSGCMWYNPEAGSRSHSWMNLASVWHLVALKHL